MFAITKLVYRARVSSLLSPVVAHYMDYLARSFVITITSYFIRPSVLATYHKPFRSPSIFNT